MKVGKMGIYLCFWILGMNHLQVPFIDLKLTRSEARVSQILMCL